MRIAQYFLAGFSLFWLSMLFFCDTTSQTRQITYWGADGTGHERVWTRQAKDILSDEGRIEAQFCLAATAVCNMGILWLEHKQEQRRGKLR